LDYFFNYNADFVIFALQMFGVRAVTYNVPPDIWWRSDKMSQACISSSTNFKTMHQQIMKFYKCTSAPVIKLAVICHDDAPSHMAEV